MISIRFPGRKASPWTWGRIRSRQALGAGSDAREAAARLARGPGR